MSQPIDLKTCSRCGASKPRADFNRRARSADGLQPKCRTCESVRKRELRKMTPDERAEATRRRTWSGDSKRCSRCHCDLSLDSFRPTTDGSRGGKSAACRQCEKQWHAEHYQRVREKHLARAKEWYEANREGVAATRAAWWRDNADRASEVRRECNARRRARLMGARVGPIDLDALPFNDCSLCGDPIEADLRWPHPMSKSVDHVIPLARGGAHVQDNLQWTHLRCNLSKGVRIPE